MQEGYQQCLGAQEEEATEGSPVGLGPEKLAAGEGTESLRYPACSIQYLKQALKDSAGPHPITLPASGRPLSLSDVSADARRGGKWLSHHSPGYCMLAGRAAASFHWSALETEQDRWCSPSGRKPAQAELLWGRSECRDALLAEWGAPGGAEGSGWEEGQVGAA